MSQLCALLHRCKITHGLRAMPYLVLFHGQALEESRPPMWLRLLLVVVVVGAALCSHPESDSLRSDKKTNMPPWKCRHCASGQTPCGMRMAPLSNRLGPLSFHLLERLTASTREVRELTHPVSAFRIKRALGVARFPCGSEIQPGKERAADTQPQE